MKYSIKQVIEFIYKSNSFLIAIFLFAFFLRIFKLDKIPPSLFIDEIWAVYKPYLFKERLLDLSFRTIIVSCLTGNYFTYSFLHSSVFFTRLPAAIYGAGLVVIIFFLGKQMFCVDVGLIASSLMAISPWAIHFSRLQIPSSSYVFFFTFFVYLSYKGVTSKEKRKREIYYFICSSVLGLTTCTHIISIVFIPIFIVGYILIVTRKLSVSVIISGLKYFIIVMLMASPTIYEYMSPNLSGVAKPRITGAYSTFSLSKGILDFFINLLERMYYHLSPDFLVFTGGGSFASEKGFSETISYSGLLRYTTGRVGILNYYGIIIYPALIYLLFKSFKRSIGEGEKILLWWILSYSITSSIAYYDNPNAARNIVGLPAFIIIIALFIKRCYNFFHMILRKRLPSKNVKVSTMIPSIIIIILITLPTIHYLNDYFLDYPTRSLKAFNYEYKIAADYLNEKGLWDNFIYLRTYDPVWYSDQILSFYSPRQPLPSNIFSVNHFEWSKEIQLRESGSLYITPFQADLEELKYFGIIYNHTREFQFPNGNTALYLVNLIMPEKLYPIQKEFSKEKITIDFSNLKVGRKPEGLKLEVQKSGSNVLIDYDYEGEEKNWWSITNVFDEPVNFTNYPIFETFWDVQEKIGGSMFIQFYIEDEKGNKIWASDDRLVYPAKRYNLLRALEEYSGNVIGIMIGGEVQNNSSGKIILEKTGFFKIMNINLDNSSTSKWSYIDIEDEKLFLNSDTKIVIRKPIPGKTSFIKAKHLLVSVLPLKGGNNYSIIELKGPLNNETHYYSYIKSDITTPQKILINIEGFNDLELITFHTKSPAIIFGIWYSIE